ncbi:MAG TPA: sulfatase-like hydrolase/transferase [Thermoanaerobaculia bacterium]|nr:sulfatase-like hydrolase/transferase [Thermoanaerobaculia bacterium]
MEDCSKRLLDLVVLGGLLLVSCSEPPVAPRGGPIVLITLDSLRADVVTGMGGEPELTPHLADLIREADWAGRAVALSSAAVPSMASLFTGLRPWQHHALHDGAARLSPELLTLPKALRSAGYRTAGYHTGHWYTGEFGYDLGFDVFEDLGKGGEAAERLAGLGEGRQFVWVHIPEPQAPYVRRDWLLPRLSEPAGSLPRLPHTIEPVQLAAYFDPAVPLPDEERRRFWALYRLNAAWADERLGRLLEALRSSGQWNRTVLAVTSNHGEEFGESGQIEHGGNLGRELLEVPLIIKLPAGSARRIAVLAGQRVSAGRLWATLVEVAGGKVPPAAAPSLFRRAAPAVLSELYLTNGTNKFSLLEGDDQLLWESRFAPAERDYYRARAELLAGPPEPGDAGDAGDSKGEAISPAAVASIARRLGAAFAATPPLTGNRGPSLSLQRWGRRGSKPVHDPLRRAEMARRLAATWTTFLTEELPPAEEAREWLEAFPLPPAAPQP